MGWQRVRHDLVTLHNPILWNVGPRLHHLIHMRKWRPREICLPGYDTTASKGQELGFNSSFQSQKFRIILFPITEGLFLLSVCLEVTQNPWAIWGPSSDIVLQESGDPSPNPGPLQNCSSGECSDKRAFVYVIIWRLEFCTGRYIYIYICHAKSLHSRPTLCDRRNCSPPSSSVHEILQSRYWSGLSCPPPEDLTDSRIKP